MATVAFGEREQPFGRIAAPVKRNVFARRSQFRIEVVIDRHLAGIDDAHVHSGGDGVIEKDRVHRLAYRLIAAEREGEIRHAARDVSMRQVLSDPARRFDEGDAVAVVLLHSGRRGENIRIENDVLRREADPVDEDVVGACGNRGLALERISLAGFVERHHHHRRAITADNFGVADEGVFAFLERDRVHHRLALNAFQSGLNHREFRGIDHYWYAGNIGLGGNEIEKSVHGLLRIEQALVHVDVENLRAVFHLVACNRKRGGVIAGGNMLAEPGRAGDVGALADVDERNRRRQREGFEAGKPQVRQDRWNLPRFVSGHRRRDGANVIGRRSATTAGDIDESGRSKLAELRGHHLRALVVMAKFVGQSGVGISAN